MAQIFTGAKAIIRLNNQVLAFAGGTNVNQEDTLTDVDILGKIEVGDLAETGHRCNFSINYFKIVNPEIQQTAVQLGVESAVLADKRNQEYFDVSVLDETTGNEIYKMENCKFEGGSGTVDARGVWQGTWNFRARKGFGL